MGILADVRDCAVRGARSRLGAMWTRRVAPGAAPSSVGRSVAVVFICAAAVLTMSVAANARSSAKASAATKAPALDAQAINAATLAAPSGKGRARTSAPSAAAVIKSEVLLDRAGFS